MNAPISAFRLASRALALAAVSILAASGSVGCDDGDSGGGAAGGTGSGAVTGANACDSAEYCYEIVGGLDSFDQAICQQLGSKVLAKCDQSKAVRKCTQITKVSEDGGPEKEVTYVYYFPEGNTSGCAGVEEKLN